jgi:hypothetical protein
MLQGRKFLLTAIAISTLTLPAQAQMGDGSQVMAMGAGRAVRGTVTAATADHLTIKTEAGEVYEVAITPNTQVRKGREQMKLADIHVGDAVGAMGEIDAPKKTVHALMVMVVDAEQVKKAREAMGKTMISGTVTAIDDVKITIKRTDDVVQTIMVDEDTSFRKGGRNMGMALAADGMGGGGTRPARAGAAPAADAAGESLTLADVKVGSVVAGPGAIKNGIFVPTQLAISDPGAQQQQQRRRRPDGAPGAPGTAPPAAPATTTPPTTGTEPK